MSKKKATMSLKDFHGGSIPSDLPLPSAPGIIVRPSDRPVYDRQTSWGNPMGRSDQRLRPGSAGATRPFDDKTPFLSNNVQIGRNFDEDERKPLDGVSGPQRMASDDSIRALPSRMDPKMDYSSRGRIHSRPASSPVTRSSIGTADSSYAARFVEANRVGVNSQNVFSGGSYSAFGQSRVGNSHQFVQGANTGVSVSGMQPNAWASNKEVPGTTEQVKMSWSVPDAASKLAHASALEKVSSGRWHMKQSSHSQSDVEVIEYPESVREFHAMGNNSPYNISVFNTMDATVKREYDDVKLARNVERGLAVDDGIHSAGKESVTHRRSGFTVFSDVQEKIPSSITDEVQHACNAARFGESELPSSVLSELTERYKLNLLPRSKPLEDKEAPTVYKKAYQLPNDLGFVDNGNESHGIASPASSGIAVSDSVNPAVERPKLNLKPRSKPSEKLDGNSERVRSMLFGGARPREVVLKERGIPDVVMNNDLSQLFNSVKQDVPKTETGFVHATPCYDEKTENTPNDRGIQTNTDRRGHLVDVEKTGTQRRNWRSENLKSDRDIEKQQHLHHPHERQPSPETWRKPVGRPNETKSDGPAPRYGKAASAVDLALSFSRSISDVKAAGHRSGNRGLPNRDHMPFSRLVDTNSRPRINGF